MSLANDEYHFPYMNVDSVYLKCIQDERLRTRYQDLIKYIYPECYEVIYPVVGDEVVTRHFTYGVTVVSAMSYVNSYADEVYAWHINPTSIIVPYGNLMTIPVKGTDWRVCVARTMRSIWHAVRTIPNDDPYHRQHVNISIPWVRLDKKSSECTDAEISDYCEIVLASASSQIWIKNKRIMHGG